MKQLVLCGIGLATLLLMSCSGTNFSSGNDSGTSDAIVSTDSTTSTSSTTLTSDYCDGMTTDFTTVQTALLNQLQSFMSQYSSGTATVSGTYYNQRNNEACRQIVTAEQIVASATGFTQDFNSILQYVCNKLYTSSEYGSDNYQSEYDEQDEFGPGQQGPPQFHEGQSPQLNNNDSYFPG